MIDAKPMVRLKDWLQMNGIPESTYHHLRKNHPDQVPRTITLGKRAKYITAEDDAAFRARLRSGQQPE